MTSFRRPLSSSQMHLPQQPHPHSHTYFIATSIRTLFSLSLSYHSLPLCCPLLSITLLFVPFALCLSRHLSLTPLLTSYLHTHTHTLSLAYGRTVSRPSPSPFCHSLQLFSAFQGRGRLVHTTIFQDPIVILFQVEVHGVDYLSYLLPPRVLYVLIIQRLLRIRYARVRKW